MSRPRRRIPSEAEVLRWADELSNRGRWGDDDRLGTLNFIGPAQRRRAAGLVTEGRAVSCGRDLGFTPSPEADRPPRRTMVALPGTPTPTRRWSAAAEEVAVVFHGYAVTHLDALSHYFLDGRTYGGRPASIVSVDDGARDLAVTDAADGIVGRGVLLDVADARGVRWLEPGTAVLPEDLEAAERAAGVRVGTGDIVLLRTGYGARRTAVGPDEVARVGRAGFHAACLPWFSEREVAVIGADTATDVHPSGYPSLRSPVHAIGIAAMGLWLIDNADLEALAAACRRLGRWEFLFVVAPLRIAGGTGSPVNPLAVL